MSWIEGLAAKIGALKDEDFEYQLIYATGRLAKFRAASVEIPLDFNSHAPDFQRMMGCVNSTPIGPAPVGCVMLVGLSIDHGGARAAFEVRRNVPWNHGLPVDSRGQGPYREVDFSTLPDSLPNSRPG